MTKIKYRLYRTDPIMLYRVGYNRVEYWDNFGWCPSKSTARAVRAVGTLVAKNVVFK